MGHIDLDGLAVLGGLLGREDLREQLRVPSLRLLVGVVLHHLLGKRSCALEGFGKLGVLLLLLEELRCRASDRIPGRCNVPGVHPGIDELLSQ